MHGLQILDLKRPGLADRLLRRRPKENAAIELNNYVAATPLADVTRAAVEEILSNHKCAPAEAKPAFAMIYTQVLKCMTEDREITDVEQEQLNHLREVFGLADEELRAIEEDVVLPIYRDAVNSSLSDQHLAPRERERLEKLSHDLRLDEAEADLIAFEASYRVFEEAMSRRAAAAAAAQDEPPQDEPPA
jgi:hypothetical protein